MPARPTADPAPLRDPQVESGYRYVCKKRLRSGPTVWVGSVKDGGRDVWLGPPQARARDAAAVVAGWLLGRFGPTWPAAVAARRRASRWRVEFDADRGVFELAARVFGRRVTLGADFPTRAAAERYLRRWVAAGEPRAG